MGQTALQMPDGSVQSFDNERLAEAVSAGATPPEHVRITLPNGAESEVPWDTYLSLQQRDPGQFGLTSQASIDAQGHLSDLEDDTSAVGAFGRHALSELSFGLYEPDEDQELADRHYHGIGSTAGSVTGMVAPLLVPGLGEAGLIGRGAELANVAREGKAITGLGRLGVEMLPGRMAAQLGSKVYEAAGGGLKGILAGGAVEGAGSEVLRSVLDRDHRLSGEALLDSAGLNMIGAGVGFGIAKGVGKAEEMFGRLGRRAEKAAMKVDDAELVQRLEQNRPLTAKQRGVTDEVHGKDMLGNVKHDVPLYSANRELVRDAGSMMRQVEAWRSSPFGKVAPELQAVIDQGMESLGALKSFAKQEPSIQAKVMGAYESHLHNVDEMASAIARQPGGLDVAKVTQRWRPENVAARQEAISKLDPSGLAPAEFAAKRLATRLTAGTGRVQVTKDVEGGLLSRLLGGRDRRGSVVSQHPLLSLMALDSIMEQGVLGVGLKGLAVAAAGKGIQKAFEVPGRGIALSGLAADGLSKVGIAHHDLPEDRGRRASAVAERIRGTSPDDARQVASQASKHVAKVAPDTFMAIGDAAANRQTALQARVNQIFPPARGALRLTTARATPSQARQLDRALLVASDPTAFVHLLARGQLSKADLQLAQQVWPAHVSRATRLASAWASENRGEVPRAVAKRLELLLGPDAVGQVRQDSFEAAQASIAAAKARIHPPGPESPPASGRPRTDLLSPSDSAGGRPTD